MQNVMNRAIWELSRRKSGSTVAIFAFSIWGILMGSLPASATTYDFVIPTGTQISTDPNSVLGALTTAIANDGFGDNPTLYAFYDFYIRPQVSGDGCLVSTDGCGASDPHGRNMAPVVGANTFNLITDYSMAGTSTTAPLPGCLSTVTYPDFPSGCTSTYNGTANVAEPAPWLGASAHFTFNNADNAFAMVTSNVNANDKNYNGSSSNPFPAGTTSRTEIMPATSFFGFHLTTTEYSSYQTPKITFEIYGVAIQYASSAATALAAKQLSFVGNFDAVGSAPEPSTIFAAGGGLLFLAFTRLRRRKLAR